MPKQEIHCQRCSRLIAVKIAKGIEIKCRCKKFNIIKEDLESQLERQERQKVDGDATKTLVNCGESL